MTSLGADAVWRGRGDDVAAATGEGFALEHATAEVRSYVLEDARELAGTDGTELVVVACGAAPLIAGDSNVRQLDLEPRVAKLLGRGALGRCRRRIGLRRSSGRRQLAALALP
jgi:hypothetical protein